MINRRGQSTQEGGNSEADLRASHLFVESVGKALRVLEAFGATRKTMNVPEIALATGLDKSAAQRFAHTLFALGYLRKDETTKRYSLSTKVLGVGFSYLQSEALVESAMREMSATSQSCGETLNCTVLDGHEVVYIARVPSRNVVRVHLTVGTRAPAYCTATGRAILAFLPREEAQAILDRSDLVRHTPSTIIEPKKILALLDTARRDGFAVTGAECWDGAIAVAAPIFDYSNHPIAAVSISVPIATWTIKKAHDELGKVVVETARRISRDLGQPA